MLLPIKLLGQISWLGQIIHPSKAYQPDKQVNVVEKAAVSKQAKTPNRLAVHEIIKPRDSQSNTIQHNSPKTVIFKEKNWTPTCDILRTRQMLYQLSYRGSSAGWGRITHTKQHNSRQSVSQPEEQANPT